MTRNYLDILAETIRNNWDQPALTDFYLAEDGTAQDTSRGNHYTYGEMYAELCHVAELLTSLGLQSGDHIAICGANSAHWVIAYLAIAKMQGVSVTVMHSLQPDEIACLVAFSDAKALFTDEDLWAELKSQPMPQVENIISLENFESFASGTSIIVSSASSPSSVSSVSSASSPSIVGFPQSAPDSLAMICFTSGSTGTSKGVMLPYSSLNVNNINNITCDLIENHRGDSKSFLAVLPFAHMYGMMDNLITHITRGMHVNIAGGIHTPHKLLSAINIIQPYGLAITPAIFDGILTSTRKQDNWFCSLNYIETGGASLSKETECLAIDKRIPYFSGYGLSELGPHITSSTNVMRKGSCGTIARKLTARISSAGEILVKGENVMLGYYKDPEATAAKIDSEGWLHTGDKGYLDEDGYLYVEGRLEQDIIVLPNGENIRPDNIESLINALPEVKESIVLARDGHLVAIVVPSSEYRETSETRASSSSSSLRRAILRTVNPELPLYSQLYDVEITDTPLARTEKQTIKRYLYK